MVRVIVEPFELTALQRKHGLLEDPYETQAKLHALNSEILLNSIEYPMVSPSDLTPAEKAVLLNAILERFTPPRESLPGGSEPPKDEYEQVVTEYRQQKGLK